MLTLAAKCRAYLIAAVASPVAIVACTYFYQSLAHRAFWGGLDPADDAARSAGAMMGFAEIGQLVVALIIGCVVGLLLAWRAWWLYSHRTESSQESPV